MTGWQIAGACLIAIPILAPLAWLAVNDPAGCCLVVAIVTSVVGVVVLGSLLLTGAWAP